MTFLPLETEIFTYQHLLDSDENIDLIQTFSVKEKTGKGLELYLKNTSVFDEKNSFARTYLIKDKRSKELAAYAHYEKFGFYRLDAEKEKFVHSHVKPKYEEGCIFMYQTI